MELATRHLTQTRTHRVDPQIWKACAGPCSVHPPPINSIVYYFPQGHAEHTNIDNPKFFSPLVLSNPYTRCRVVNLMHLVREDTDEIFVMIRLIPLLDNEVVVSNAAVDDVMTEGVKTYMKMLTYTDISNSLIIPRVCANYIFPNLDLENGQELSMSDLQGNVWMFTHLKCGGTHRFRITEWRRFVANKKLSVGDSIVFICDDRNNTLHIAIRRASNLKAVGNEFYRRELGMVLRDDVSKAASKAVDREAFELVHYPVSGFANFLVNAELAYRTCNYPWVLGVRVRMKSNEYVNGSVVVVGGYDVTGLWDVNSPWRKLMVHWYHSEIRDERISPWDLLVDREQPSNVLALQKDNTNPGPAVQGDNAQTTMSIRNLGTNIRFV